MRDTTKLEGKIIQFNNETYKIESFQLVPSTGQIYVKLKNKTKIYLNVALSTLIPYFNQIEL